MNIGIIGGSFDPPHIAHTLLGLLVLETRGLERLLYVPTYRHPLGKEAVAGFEQRLAMTRLAVAPLGRRAEVLDIEASLPAPSYTIDTIRALKSRHPEDTLRLVIGSDILAEREQWKDFAEIERLAPPIVIPRAGFCGPEEVRLLPDVRSREVRRMILGRQDAGELVAESVLKYIREQRLYIER